MEIVPVFIIISRKKIVGFLDLVGFRVKQGAHLVTFHALRFTVTVHPPPVEPVETGDPFDKLRGRG